MLYETERASSEVTNAEPVSREGATFRLSRSVFLLFQELVQAESGIWLAEHKKRLLIGRLSRRLRQLEVASFESYYRRVAQDAKERELMLDLLTTNETHFFRDPKQFQYLEQVLVSEWTRLADAGKRPRLLNIWSAGCSTGEEACSILMVLLDHFPRESGWRIRLLATDISRRALEKAEQGVWPIAQAEEIPAARLKRYMLKGIGGSNQWMRAKPLLKDHMSFTYLNLNAPEYGLDCKFDVIFCRNVLIYFSAAGKTEVARKLFAHLAPCGHLFFSPVESSASRQFGSPVFPGVYAGQE